MEGGREGGRGKEGGREMKGGREGGRGKEGGRKMEEGEGRVIKGDSNIVTTDHLNEGHLNKHHIGYQSSHLSLLHSCIYMSRRSLCCLTIRLTYDYCVYNVLLTEICLVNESP